MRFFHASLAGVRIFMMCKLASHQVGIAKEHAAGLVAAWMHNRVDLFFVNEFTLSTRDGAMCSGCGLWPNRVATQ